MMKIVCRLFLISAALFFSCQSEGNDALSNEEDPVVVKINAKKQERFQTIAHFGASDAWACQFVGLWPDQKKQAIASLLFSKEFDGQGKPKGIGLSLWRFNIGAGSAEQGEQSGISDEWRRAESFLNSDGSYDWSKQAGQVWFAKSAQEFGVEHLLVFPNSPPVSLTRTGKAFSENGQSNLSAEKYDEFGKYLAEVVEGLQQKGLDVDYISPVNEPQWDWSDGGQEGSPFWNNEIAGIVRELDKELGARGLKTKIDLAEAGKVNYLFEEADKEGRGKQIKEFFTPESENYIGDLPHLGKAISGHSYFTTSPFTSSVQLREILNSKIQAIEGLEFWMSEYCILGDNGGEINGNGRDLGIDPALYMARVIHNDLTVANASAWHWWLAVSPYDYKDGLVYIDYSKDDGEYYDSKMLWTLGNYSRFIRPGYQRLAIDMDGINTGAAELLVSAFVNPENEQLVYVIVNSGIKALKTQLSESGDEVNDFKAYITSDEQDLAPVQLNGVDNEVLIPARSIVTIVTE